MCAESSFPTSAREDRRLALAVVHAETKTSVSAWCLLDRAAEQLVRERLDDEFGDRAALESPLSVLCRAMRGAGGGASATIADLPSNVAARRLVDALRSRFLQLATSSATVDPSESLRVLLAMDTLQRTLDADPTQRFVNRLSGPEAVELLVSVAHDLRSPLSSILFLVDTLRNGDSGAVNAHQLRQLLLVYSAAFGLSAAASDLIDLARGGDGLLEATAIPFSIKSCLESVRDITSPIAEEKKLAVNIEPPQVDIRVGHPAALTRILLNLTTNALKFTDAGGVTVRITEPSRQRLEFSVRDTGRGIPPDVLETLFDAFRLAPNRHRYMFSSAGLGLSICSTLVRRLGGELSAESAPGAGTCFRFSLDMPPQQRL